MINIKKFFKDIYNKGNFKDYFKRNRLFFIISIFLVVLSFYNGLKGININSNIISIIYPFALDVNKSNTYSLFVGNIIYSLYTIILGLTLSIASIFVVIFNEVSLSTSISITTLPYIVNDIFVLVGAFLVSKIELRFIGQLSTMNLKSILYRIKVPVKDLILTITFVVIIVLLISLSGLI